MPSSASTLHGAVEARSVADAVTLHPGQGSIERAQLATPMGLRPSGRSDAAGGDFCRGLRPLPQTTGSRSRLGILVGADFSPRPGPASAEAISGVPNALVAGCARSHRPPALAADSESLWERTSVRDRGPQGPRRSAGSARAEAISGIPNALVAGCARSHRPPVLAASSESLWERTSVRDRGPQGPRRSAGSRMPLSRAAPAPTDHRFSQQAPRLCGSGLQSATGIRKRRGDQRGPECPCRGLRPLPQGRRAALETGPLWERTSVRDRGLQAPRRSACSQVLQSRASVAPTTRPRSFARAGLTPLASRRSWGPSRTRAAGPGWR
jgi:hypothetical protein